MFSIPALVAKIIDFTIRPGGTRLNLMIAKSKRLTFTPEKMAVIQRLTGKMNNNSRPDATITSAVIIKGVKIIFWGVQLGLWKIRLFGS